MFGSDTCLYRFFYTGIFCNLTKSKGRLSSDNPNERV